MLKFDFNKYMSKFIDLDDMNNFLNEKKNIIDKFMDNDMTGWYKERISSDVLENIITTSETIKNNSDVLIVIGIGGSYMGSFSISELFLNKFKKIGTEVIYVGTSLSGTYLDEVIDYIKDKNYSVNVVSKSGGTLEIKIAYQIMKNLLYDKYGENAKDRIYLTTNSKSGYLHEEAINNGYMRFDMPDSIGGRYSLITPAHLLPLAVQDINIEELINGYYDGKKYIDDAFYYASLRNYMFNKGKYIENFSSYNPKFNYYLEFLKQLFGESEGKDLKGIFPVSTINTRDLHSLGQFLQEGNKIIFETVIRADKQSKIEFNGNSISKYNNIVEESVIESHYNGDVPNNIIDIGELSLYSIGELSMFMMMSAAFSAYIFGVDPFNQPGVEGYKNIANEKINNI